MLFSATSHTTWALLTQTGVNVYSSLKTLQNAVDSARPVAIGPACSITGLWTVPESTLSKSVTRIPYYNILWAQSAATASSGTSSDDKLVHSDPIKLSYMKPKSHANELDPESIEIVVVSTNSYFPAVVDLKQDANSSSVDESKLTAKDALLQYAYSFSIDGVIHLSSSAPGTPFFKLQKHFLVIINPKSGSGKARQVYEQECAPVLAMAHCKTTIIETTHRSHATEYVRDLEFFSPDSGDKIYDAIICCSGDGIPHEVFNGLAQRRDSRYVLANVPIAQLPCGSGNAMAFSVHGHRSPSAVSLGFVKAQTMAIDLMLMTTAGKPSKTMSFLTQTFGLIADADFGTTYLRWMGQSRFNLGVATRILTMKQYPCDLYIKYVHKTKESVQEHVETYQANSSTELHDPQARELDTRYGTADDPVPTDWDHVDGSDTFMFYTGNMPWISIDTLMFPAVLPADGCMDLIISKTSMPRATTAKMMLSLETGAHVDLAGVQYSKIEAYRLVPKSSAEGLVAVDGEFVSGASFQVEVVPKCARLLSPTASYYPSGFGSSM